jgi:hypothetical protein
MELPESQNFLQKIYDNGGKGYFDVVAIHLRPPAAGRCRRFSTVRGRHAHGDGS